MYCSPRASGPSVISTLPLVGFAVTALSRSSSTPPAHTYSPAASISATTALASGPRSRNHSSGWLPTHCWLK